MDTLKKNARIAGLIYLSMVLTAPLRLMYIPSTLFVRGDATATANNILAHETLFRLGMLGDLLTGVIAIFTTLAFYRLFKDVDKYLARLLVIFGSFMVTPIYFVNTVNDAAALMLVRGGEYLSVFQKPQLDAMAMFFLRLHHAGIVANELFWGLWLLPFGLLVMRSHFLPRFLGIWLIINGLAYMIICFVGILAPQYETMVFNRAFPAMLGEPAIMLWLVIMGAKMSPLASSREPLRATS
jgi:hypothetical protein